jgi:hypothetical protein
VVTNLKEVKISTKQQAYAIDCIVQYVDDLMAPILLKNRGFANRRNFMA